MPKPNLIKPYATLDQDYHVMPRFHGFGTPQMLAILARVGHTDHAIDTCTRCGHQVVYSTRTPSPAPPLCLNCVVDLTPPAKRAGVYEADEEHVLDPCPTTPCRFARAS